MMRTTYTPPPDTGSNTLFERLLARGDRQVLVTVHQRQITKLTPVAATAVCAGVPRPPTGLVDNGKQLNELLAQDYGQYLVTVCAGRIVAIAAVEREHTETIQTMQVKSAKRKGE